uniref:Uncharacterized protein n=1 Tax=Heterorhabditis bacteriophora TaxID=37862 RepID=A0A1I7WWK4_HETBA
MIMTSLYEVFEIKKFLLVKSLFEIHVGKIKTNIKVLKSFSYVSIPFVFLFFIKKMNI